MLSVELCDFDRSEFQFERLDLIFLCRFCLLLDSFLAVSCMQPFREGSYNTVRTVSQREYYLLSLLFIPTHSSTTFASATLSPYTYACHGVLPTKYVQILLEHHLIFINPLQTF
jgi:hypothetical protein